MISKSELRKRERRAKKLARRAAVANQGEFSTDIQETEDIGNKYFLHVKAIWFNATVFDTNDISTIRGSSLSLLFVPDCLLKHLREELDGKWQFEVVLSGASSLLLACVPSSQCVDTDTDTDIESVAMMVRHYLAQTQDLTATFPVHYMSEDTPSTQEVNLSDFRFTVTVSPIVLNPKSVCVLQADGSEGKASNRMARGFGASVAPLSVADAAAAFSQYCQPSFITLGKSDRGAEKAKSLSGKDSYCSLNGDLPASGVDNTRIVSASVKNRRMFGRDRKRDFYLNVIQQSKDPRRAKLAKKIIDLEFSHTLSDLLMSPPDITEGEMPKHSIELPPSLSGKIAIIHLDGNKFGSRLADMTGIKDQTGFSEMLREAQADMLVELLSWYISDDARSNDLIAPAGYSVELQRHVAPRIRLETLLWGGDEMVFAVPAWRGWELVGVLEKALRRFSYKAGRAQVETYLTHSIGLCFTNVKTPVRQMSAMADELSDSAKSLNGTTDTNFVFSVGIANGADMPAGGILAQRASQFEHNSVDDLTFLGTERGEASADWDAITESYLALVRVFSPGRTADLIAAYSNEKLRLLRQGKALDFKQYLNSELDRLFFKGTTEREEAEGALNSFVATVLPLKLRDKEYAPLFALKWRRYLDGFVMPLNSNVQRLDLQEKAAE
jgi:hypothetical protein